MYANIRKEILNTNSPAEINYHSVPPDWMRVVEDDCRENNLVTSDHLDNIDVYTDAVQKRFAGPYGNLRKIPDLCIIPDNQYQSSFVIEFGWSESHRRLMDDMRLWLEGADPHVKTVMVIKFTLKKKTNIVRGTAELYARNPAGRPVRQQLQQQVIIQNGGCYQKEAPRHDNRPRALRQKDKKAIKKKKAAKMDSSIKTLAFFSESAK